MPTKPLRPCLVPGCAALVPAGYCERHRTRAAGAMPRDSAADAIRRGRNWRRLSELIRRLQPICVDPLGHHGTWPKASSQVHHILGLESRPDLAFEMSNLAAVCTRCHSQLEQQERAGKPTAHLFEGKDAETTQTQLAA